MLSKTLKMECPMEMQEVAVPRDPRRSLQNLLKSIDRHCEANENFSIECGYGMADTEKEPKLLFPVVLIKIGKDDFVFPTKEAREFADVLDVSSALASALYNRDLEQEDDRFACMRTVIEGLREGAEHAEKAAVKN